jgi:DNA recombination protein RmuC
VLALQEDNARQLGEMRLIVEEKLQGALEKRLGESFSQVSQQLEQVYKGLGEMQTLATGVGDLKRVLSNVKARGGWGEVMLGTLLSDTLSPDQYQQNVRTKAESKEVVEFVIRLPGRGTYDQPVLLPVDSKFPLEDYERLMRAQESLDQAGMEESSKALEQRIKQFAKDIRDKYLDPPQTTDFGVMFIPSEGLYAEVVRRGPLVETLRREFQVVVAGPSTFSALLNSLQMGFRTLAIEKRSSEVWQLLGAVKTEFGRFGTVLDQVKKKLDEASSTMEKAAQRSRAIERKLRQVEVLPSEQAAALLESPTNELLSESGDDSAALP